MQWMFEPDVWISLITLTLLEVVLGIDNLVFLSILSGKLPREDQARARRMGLSLAVITRILLLSSLSWVMKLEHPLTHIQLFGFHLEPSIRDLILFLGGLFLIGNSTREIQERLDTSKHEEVVEVKRLSFRAVILQILILDMVFSLDSVITAVGMANRIGVMIAAVILATGVMLSSVNVVSAIIERHPSIKLLALAFLILIGTALVAEALHQPLPKGYIYFSMGFAAVVEMLNARLRTKKRNLPDNESPHR
jgi:predicted tellurium resistance membrane protein TerC